MRKARKRFIELEFDERKSVNLDVLSEALGIQLKEVKRWRTEGLISYPVTKEEFDFLVKMANTIWGNYRALRCQLAEMNCAKRQVLVRTAELNPFEIEVFNMVLRWKLEFPRRYLHFNEARKMLRARFPNGYVQLTAKMLVKAKKAANYEISKAQKNGMFDILLQQLSMEIEGGKRIHKRRKGSGKLSDDKAKYQIENNDKDLPAAAIQYQNNRNITPQTFKPVVSRANQVNSGLTEEGLEYLRQNFESSYEKRKIELEEKIKETFRKSPKGTYTQL
jgi:hypothetical protein